MRLVDITWMTADEANYRARWIAYIGDAIYPVSILASKLAILSLYRRLFVLVSATALEGEFDLGGPFPNAAFGFSRAQEIAG